MFKIYIIINKYGECIDGIATDMHIAKRLIKELVKHSCGNNEDDYDIIKLDVVSPHAYNIDGIKADNITPIN